MWQFRSGMIGVAIVIISLAAASILGVLVNVNQEDVEKDSDKFVTDITGLYSTSSKEKAYVPYDPASNYNGYSTNVLYEYPVSFTPTQAGNNYPFDKELAEPYTDSVSFSSYGGYTTYTPTNRLSLYRNVADQRVDVGDYYARGSITGPMSIPGDNMTRLPNYYVNLDTFLNYLTTRAGNYGTGLTTIAIEYTSVVQKYTYSATNNGITLDISTLYPSNTYRVISSSVLNDILAASTFDQQIDSLKYPYSELSDKGEGGVSTYRLEYTAATDIFTYARDGNIIYSGNPADFYMYNYGGKLSISGNWYEYPATVITQQTSFYSISTPLDYVFRPVYSYSLSREFLDTRYGVSIRSGETVTWSNTYQNGSFNILAYLGQLDRDGNGISEIGGLEQSKSIRWQFNYSDTYSSVMTLNHIANGTTSLTIQYCDATDPNNVVYYDDTVTDLGSGWIAYNISVDAINGSVTVQPIPQATFNNFTDWTSNQQIINVGSFRIKTLDDDNNTVWTVNTSPVTTITITSPESGLTHSVGMQISNTVVFLNTYGVIMIDPHVDILNWYPNNERFKIKFTKISALGTSIKFNNVVYDLDGSNITIGEDIINLSEFEVEYELQENDTYLLTITSMRDGTSVTIEDVTDTEIAMSGAWYFNSGYYTIEKVTVKEYAWNIAGGIAYGYSGVVLFMMIFTGVMTLIWWRVQPGMLGFFDIAIIIGAEIILFVILV